MHEKLHDVVIATSLAEGSESIVRAGVAVARATGAHPWLLHVYLPPAFAYEQPQPGGLMVERQEAMVREGLARQARQTGLAELPGFDPDRLAAVVGSPPRAVADFAREVRAGLIVVGATEAGRLQRILLGSTADGVIRNASCPVLVLREGVAFPPTRVELPVDLSPLSAGALRHGLELLAALGAPLNEAEAVFVLDPDEIGRSRQFSPEQIERFAADELRRFVDAHAPRTLMTPPRSRVRVGLPRQEILAVLDARHADLAVLGTHGRSGFERLTLGSVAAEVAHHATCNLLVLPPDAALRRQHEKADEEAIYADGDWQWVSDEVLV